MKVKYNRDNHPKVRDQPQHFKEHIYPVYCLTEINIEYNGGIKFHRQYNEEIAHLQNLSGSVKNYGARLFLYMVNLAYKRGNTGFKVSLDNHLFTNKGKDAVSFKSWEDTLEAVVLNGYGKLYRGCSTKELIDLDQKRYVSVFELYPKAFNLLKGKDVNKSPNTSIPKVAAKHLLELTVKHKQGKKEWETPYPTMKGSKPFLDNLNTINNHNLKFVFRDKHGVIFDPTHRRKFSLYADEDKNEGKTIFESYGRFINYVQQMTETDRGLIKIGDGVNEWEVVEIDYSSNHARIAYELEGIRLDEDFKPYYIDDKITPIRGSQEAKRAVYKSAIMMLFNSGNPTLSLYNTLSDALEKIQEKGVDELSYRKKVLKELIPPSREDCSKVIRLIKQANQQIIDWFTGNNAAKLQNLDSRIAEHIMLSLASLNIPFLCIHDSFIVPKQHAKALKEAMGEAWESILGSRDCCVVDVKKPKQPKITPIIEDVAPSPTLEELLLECGLLPFTRAGALKDTLRPFPVDEVRATNKKLIEQSHYCRECGNYTHKRDYCNFEGCSSIPF
ncbi:hypothetical protein Q8V59_004209 [Vibrio vulnificus]|nr:hypothetical protein [Vibrio vulnificus]